MVASLTIRQLALIFALIIGVVVGFLAISQAYGLSSPLFDQLDSFLAKLFGGGTA